MAENGALRVLHLEDDPHDRELVASTLRRDGMSCSVVVVATRQDFEAALRRDAFDVILADDRLPGFDGLSAQRIAMDLAPDIPFIFVSGTLGEDIAVERIKNGAIDYVLKQKLTRLPSSILRAIAEARMRSEHARATEHIHRLNAELEQRVLERTEQLEAANRSLADREQALRHSEERLQAILDNSPALVSLKDLEGRYLFVNREFERATGLARAQAQGRADRDLFPRGIADIYRNHDEAALRQPGPVTVEEPAFAPDGLARVHEASHFQLTGADGRPYAVCTIAADITTRKRAEEEIKAARLEAERANRAKSEFLSRMSHDLRTPLNAVLGFAQLLAHEELPPSHVECVRQILRGGEHLLFLINEVLDIARIEAGQLSLSPEPVEVGAIVRESVALVAPIAQSRAVAVDVERSALLERAVVADRQRLSQVLLNLLSNAVKYNREAGSVTVSVEQVPSGMLRINVTDTGPGIPPQKLRLLFRPFERLGAETTTIEGTGLGLTLARGLAEAMGGGVGVVSRLDTGSTFWVELLEAPAGMSDGASHHVRSAAAPATLAPATILYIEDNMANVRLMQRILGSHPQLELVTAGNGQSGLDQARTRAVDLVLLDLHLPDMTGEHVLLQIQSDPQLRDIPVIVLSADATPGQIRRLRTLGAAEYLTKPFEIQSVLNVLARVLQSSKAAASADEVEHE